MVSVNAPVILPRLISGYPGSISEIQQMPYGVGTTFPELVDTIATWIPDELIPYMISLNKNNDQVIDILNQALTNQTESVMAQLATVLAEIIAGENVELNDGSILAAVETANSVTIAFLNGLYLHYAPAPTGDDTAALMGYFAGIHTAGATAYLRAGTYVCNINLAPQFQQIRIVGAGMRATILKAKNKALPVVKFNGGSGGIGGGGIEQLSLISADNANREGIALAFSGCNGVRAEMVKIAGSFAEGVRFWNERPNDFTEFNTFEGDVSGCDTPFRYHVDNGVESFHGSGIAGNTTVNIPDTCNEIIYVHKNGMPYNAPLSMTVFFRGQDTRLIHLSSDTRPTGRHPSFYGVIRAEGVPSTPNFEMGVCDSKIANVLFAGEIMWLGSGTAKLGNIFLVNKVSYQGGNVWGERRPVTTQSTLKNTPTIIATEFEPGCICLVAVAVMAPNYEFHALLAIQQSAFNGAQGFIVEIARTQDLDTGNVGDPVFGFNNALYCSNVNFTNQFTTVVTTTFLGGGNAHSPLAQAMDG